MSRPRFTRRDRAAVVDGKRDFHGPDDDVDDGEGDTPDITWPVFVIHEEPQAAVLPRRPQDLAEQQEQQQ